MPQQLTSPSQPLEARSPNPMITTVKTSSVVQGMPKYRSMLAGNPAYSPSSYESIATATGTGSSATLTFNSIPSGFKHLKLRGIVQAVGGGTSGAMNLIFNSDTATNYSEHRLQGNGTTPSAIGSANSTSIYVARPVRNTSYSNTLGAFVIDILDYGSTTKNKTLRALSGYEINGEGIIMVLSGAWLSTNAITSITLTDSSFNLSTKTTVALYGIKEA